MTEGATWNIRLSGDFAVEDPAGREVVLPSRKARALLALLALNQGVAVARSELSEALWPHSAPSKQFQSLRQSLRELRRAFAPVEPVEATRDTCRLSLPNWTCDAVEALEGRIELAEPLLPQMTEPAFAKWRSELSHYLPAGEWAGAVRGAVATLSWLRDHEPQRVLDVLYAIRELIPYMPLAPLKEVLTVAREASSGSPLEAWGEMQLALALLWLGDHAAGMAVVKSVLERVRPDQDLGDWTSAVFAAGTFLIFRGRIDRAQTLLTGALEIASRVGSSAATDRIRHSLAHAHAYQGDLIRALQLLNQCDDTTADAALRAMRAAHRSVYSLFNGDIEEAERQVFVAKTHAGDSPDPRLTTQVKLAEAYVHIWLGNDEIARQILVDVRHLCEDANIPIVFIHSVEGLALVEQDPAKRRDLMDLARSVREKHRFPLLPLDRIRLARMN